MIAIREIVKKTNLEIGAVILICRVFFNTAREEELVIFLQTNELDWKLFYRLVSKHHIRPVINKVVSNLKITEEINKKLQGDCKQIVLKNFEHYRELLRLNKLFEEANIKAVPYKGCFFSLQFYSDISLREFSDIDFLISPYIEDVESIAGIMVANGYTNGFEITEAFKKNYFRHTREFKFLLFENGKRKFLVEFHTTLNDPIFETQSPIPNKYLFTGLNEDMLSGKKITTLSPTMHFIAILSHHGIAGQWAYFKNIIDIAQAIKSPANINWDMVLESSYKYRFNKVFNISLNIADDLFGIHPGFKYQKVKSVAPWLNNLFSSHQYPLDRTWRNNFYLKLKSKDSFNDSVQLVLKHIAHISTPSINDYNFARLPKALFFLYVFIKPVRMLKSKFVKVDGKT